MHSLLKAELNLLTKQCVQESSIEEDAGRFENGTFVQQECITRQ